MPVNISPLVHIEIVVRDAKRAYQFLHNVFGAEKVQEDFANFLDGPANRVIHVELGGVVLQFIQPLAEGTSWYEQLAAHGPGVHNLTFVVDDVEEAARLLEEEGVTDRFTFPLDWGQLLGPENVKPDPRPVYMINTMDKLGFRLELAESPAREGIETPAELLDKPEPVGETVKTSAPSAVSPMLHIELAVPNVDQTCALLNKVFGVEKVEEKFADFLDGDFNKVIHVAMGETVLQYCEPQVEMGSWYEQVKTKGPGVHNLTYLVENMEETVTALEKEGASVLLTFPLDWGQLVGPENVRPDVAPVHMIDTMDILGFHLELGERPTDGPVDFLYRSI
ncbi:MAG: VOC family protein [Deltaproteobacteria bacterium]|nr:VOC family protein [Deltaproteobacteria bacterium]